MDSLQLTMKVYSYTIVKDPKPFLVAVNWWEGLRLVIEKDGQKITLEDQEVAELVRKLPRTFSGKY